MGTLEKRERIAARNRLSRAVRDELGAMGFHEVETPILVRAPGMEPPIQAFASEFVPELGGLARRPLWLHTSPEYAMKRLLSDGWERLFQLTKVFRNGEVSPTHNPEFTMLELYRARTDYAGIMDDLEQLVRASAAALGVGGVRWAGNAANLSLPFERLSVREAMLRHTGLDVAALADVDALRSAAVARGFHVPESGSWDDVFFAIFLTAVEPKLGVGRACFLTEYPARMAALARVSPSNPAVAERFELYVAGLELANGFSELTDPAEQRRRLLAEQDERRAAGREVYPIDEVFLEALGRMPPAAGVAVGFDRLLMLLTGAETISDVLLFPAHEEWL